MAVPMPLWDRDLTTCRRLPGEERDPAVRVYSHVWSWIPVEQLG